MSRDDLRARRQLAAKAAAQKSYPPPTAKRRDDEVMACGTPLNEWQKRVIREWHRTHPNPVVMTWGAASIAMTPCGGWCVRCGEPGVSIPADDILTNHKTEGRFFICPRCSLASVAVAASE